jgi:hypothetical protein
MDIHDERSEKSRVLQSQPTKFYLKGKVTVHAFQRHSGRVEPPHFADLTWLPLRSVGEMAEPLYRDSETISAVLQAVIPRANDTSHHGPIGRPRIRDESGKDVGKPGDQVLSFTDAQISGLQLLCGTAANIIQMRFQSAEEQTIRKRSAEFLTISAEINSLARLTDFEQQVKISLMSFFNVACVRLCFFDADSRMLLTAATRPYRSGAAAPQSDQADDILQTATVGRRQLMHIRIEEGVVGKCTRKLQVMHVDRVIMSADISERADGIDMSGRSTDLNMLAGPMVANLGDRDMIIGTLQLIDKKRKADTDTGAAVASWKPEVGKHTPRSVSPGEAFSEEDQRFFSEMLKIVGMAAHRTMQLQARNEKDDIVISVPKLLAR